MNWEEISDDEEEEQGISESGQDTTIRTFLTSECGDSEYGIEMLEVQGWEKKNFLEGFRNKFTN